MVYYLRLHFFEFWLCNSASPCLLAQFASNKPQQHYLWSTQDNAVNLTTLKHGRCGSGSIPCIYWHWIPNLSVEVVMGTIATLPTEVANESWHTHKILLQISKSLTSRRQEHYLPWEFYVPKGDFCIWKLSASGNFLMNRGEEAPPWSSQVRLLALEKTILGRLCQHAFGKATLDRVCLPASGTAPFERMCLCAFGSSVCGRICLPALAKAILGWNSLSHQMASKHLRKRLLHSLKWRPGFESCADLGNKRMGQIIAGPALCDKSYHGLVCWLCCTSPAPTAEDQWMFLLHCHQ